MRSQYTYVSIAIVCSLMLVGAQRAQVEKPKFKAIWEPVNYPQDASLRDVFFVGADLGWAVGSVSSDAGEGGVILHTADGAQHWDVQLGDPHSATRGFEELFYLDGNTAGPPRALATFSAPQMERPGKRSASCRQLRFLPSRRQKSDFFHMQPGIAARRE
jgi:hypothetical protein